MGLLSGPTHEEGGAVQVSATGVRARCPICLKEALWDEYWVMLDLGDPQIVELLSEANVKINIPPITGAAETADATKDGDTSSPNAGLAPVDEGAESTAPADAPPPPDTDWLEGVSVNDEARPADYWVLLDAREPATHQLLLGGRADKRITVANAVRVCPSERSLRGRADRGRRVRLKHGDLFLPDWTRVPDIMGSADDDSDPSEPPQRDLFPGYRIDPNAPLHHTSLTFGEGGEVLLIPVFGDSQAGKSCWILSLASSQSPPAPIKLGNTLVTFGVAELPPSLTKMAELIETRKDVRETFFSNRYFGTEKSSGAHVLIEVDIQGPDVSRTVRLLLADFAGEAQKSGQLPWNPKIMEEPLAYASGLIFLRSAADFLTDVPLLSGHQAGDGFAIPSAIPCLAKDGRRIPAVYAFSQADRLMDSGTMKSLIQDRGNLADLPDGAEPDDVSDRTNRYMRRAATDPDELLARDLDLYNEYRYGAFYHAAANVSATETIEYCTEAVGSLALSWFRDGDLRALMTSKNFGPVSAHACSARWTVGIYEPLLAMLHHLDLLG